MESQVCMDCSIEIDPRNDEAHVVRRENDPEYIVCDVCYQDRFEECKRCGKRRNKEDGERRGFEWFCHDCLDTMPIFHTGAWWFR